MPKLSVIRLKKKINQDILGHNTNQVGDNCTVKQDLEVFVSLKHYISLHPLLEMLVYT